MGQNSLVYLNATATDLNTTALVSALMSKAIAMRVVVLVFDAAARHPPDAAAESERGYNVPKQLDE